MVVMRSKRKNVEFKEKEKSRRKVIRLSASKSKSKSMEARIKEFHTTISVGPTYSCSICNLLCYKKSISSIIDCKIPINNAYKKCFDNENVNVYICNTCKRHIKANSIPPMATVNGFKFPSVADELIGLHHLEWRLLSPRITFMKKKAAKNE